MSLMTMMMMMMMMQAASRKLSPTDNCQGPPQNPEPQWWWGRVHRYTQVPHPRRKGWRRKATMYREVPHPQEVDGPARSHTRVTGSARTLRPKRQGIRRVRTHPKAPCAWQQDERLGGLGHTQKTRHQSGHSLVTPTHVGVP